MFAKRAAAVFLAGGVLIGCQAAHTPKATVAVPPMSETAVADLEQSWRASHPAAMIGHVNALAPARRILSATAPPRYPLPRAASASGPRPGCGDGYSPRAGPDDAASGTHNPSDTAPGDRDAFDSADASSRAGQQGADRSE